jgi:hypothetical protein
VSPASETVSRSRLAKVRAQGYDTFFMLHAPHRLR